MAAAVGGHYRSELALGDPIMNEQRARTATAAAKARAKRAEPNAVTAVAAFDEPARRTTMIAEAAYFRAEKRGFSPGQQLDDWLAAELEIDRTLADERAPAVLLE
jgi:hypothetical protein